MTATNRGSERNRDDYYATPTWVTKLILPRIKSKATGRWIIEPGAGDGAILRAMVEDGFPPERMVGVEANKERADAMCTVHRNVNVLPLDWFSPDVQAKLDKLGVTSEPRIVIGNPPFSKAEEFIVRSLQVAGEDGIVVMLLRLGFLESKKRCEFHKAHPAHVYVLTTRPSFIKGKGTDSTAYGWFVWGDRKPGRWETLEGGPPRKIKEARS